MGSVIIPRRGNIMIHDGMIPGSPSRRVWHTRTWTRGRVKSFIFQPKGHHWHQIPIRAILLSIPSARLSSEINASFQGQPSNPSIPRKEPESAGKRWDVQRVTRLWRGCFCSILISSQFRALWAGRECDLNLEAFTVRTQSSDF
jgi:hypothetical protein